jgi:hypothetical protein
VFIIVIIVIINKLSVGTFMYSLYSDLKDIYKSEKTLLLIIIFAFIFYFLLVCCQYFYHAPYYTNNIESTFYTGFLNGYFCFINAALSLFSHLNWIDTQYYLFNTDNINKDYTLGFSLGVISPFLYGQFLKSLIWIVNKIKN